MKQQLIILLVEDNPENIRVATKSLKVLGNIVTAETYERAIELINRDKFDCAILDLMLPQANDNRVNEKIKSMLLDCELYKYGRYDHFAPGEIQQALKSHLLPLGTLVMERCIDMEIPFTIVTDVDHHEGYGNPGAATARMLYHRITGKSNFFRLILTPRYGHEEEFKKNPKVWEKALEYAMA